jgi:hypothetical protein
MWGRVQNVKCFGSNQFSSKGGVKDEHEGVAQEVKGGGGMCCWR